MNLFKSKDSIESRLATAEQDLIAEKTHVTELETENVKLSADNDQLKAELETAREEAAASEEGRQASQAAYEKLAADAELNQTTVATLASWMGIEGEVTKESLNALVEKRAHTKALEIAAAQGCAPVITDPSVNGLASDETKLAFEQAAQEQDPIRKAVLYKRASEKVNRKK